MTSLISGYAYDIFISYRQKDNRHDGWVTEFVNNLKGQLGSAFKEEVTVYFDYNPHDGILETHDVNASLNEKLKCLVFIPIISRTYCDPNSYAWEHEFKAFIDQASNDEYGLKIKLQDGNVGNRVLPVQIYEIDQDDINLVQSVFGGALRGIEFIHKEAGVNRPLRPDDDPKENLNRTTYRNQVNKVANTVREIITALKKKNAGEKAPETISASSDSVNVSSGNWKLKILVASFIFLALVILGYSFIYRHHGDAKPLEKSIAVLPFINDSPDKENTYFINGIMDEILNNLQKIRDMRVLSRTSVEQYRNSSKSSVPQIARGLGVNYIVEGSGQKYGDKFILRVQLIAAGNEKHLWGKSYEQEIHETSDIINIQSQIAQGIAEELNSVITPEEKQLIEKANTANLTAYDFYQRGRDKYMEYWMNNKNREALKSAEKLFNKALGYDSNFAQAYSGLANVYWSKHYYDEYFSKNFLDSVQILADMALSHDPQLSDAFDIKGAYYAEKGFTKKAMDEYGQALKYNPNDWKAYYGLGNLYGDDDHIRAIENLQKSVALNRGSELPYLLRGMAMAYDASGFIDKAKYYNAEILKLDGDSVNYFLNLVEFERNLGNFEKALALSLKVNKLDPDNLTNLFEGLARNYMLLGNQKESLEYYKIWIEKMTALKQFELGGMHRIGYAYWENGFKKEAEFYFDKQLDFCKKVINSGRPDSRETYTYYDLAGVYAFRGDKEKAYKYLKIFNQSTIFPLWMVTLIKNDPLFNGLRSDAEFQQIQKDVERKYQAEHDRVGKWLEEKGN